MAMCIGFDLKINGRGCFCILLKNFVSMKYVNGIEV